jgi:hypothetical protein
MTIQRAIFDLEPGPPGEDGQAVTERVMLDALHARYCFTSAGARRYAVAEHVGNRPVGATRIADFVAMDLWRSGAFEIHGHEVKISRSDWRAELADPDKAAEFIPYTHRWWLVITSAGMVHPGELPEQWGLIELRGGTLRQVKEAPARAALPLPPARLAALMRAVQKTAAAQAVRELAREAS